jgi:hypothetical protein
MKPATVARMQGMNFQQTLAHLCLDVVWKNFTRPSLAFFLCAPQWIRTSVKFGWMTRDEAYRISWKADP